MRKKIRWNKPERHDVRVGQIRRWNRNSNTFLVISIVYSSADSLEDEVEVMYADGFIHAMYAVDMIKLASDDDSYSTIVCEP